MTPKIEVKTFQKMIKPIRAKHNNQYYSIRVARLPYVVKGYRVRLIDNKVREVYIDGQHPNADPHTHSLCIPKNVHMREWDGEVQKMLEYLMGFYNLDDCYFNADDLIENWLICEKLNVIGGLCLNDRKEE